MSTVDQDPPPLWLHRDSPTNLSEHDGVRHRSKYFFPIIVDGTDGGSWWPVDFPSVIDH